MIERMVDYFLSERKLVLALTFCLFIGGLYTFRYLNIEAYPDPAPPTLEIVTQYTNWSAEQMEQQVTIPLEIQLNGMLNLTHMRSVSLFGLSDIHCYFSYTSNYWTDRQEVINRINLANATLPPGVTATLSPESAIGEIYRYELVGDGYTLRELKEENDWTCVRYFKQVPGVVDVATFGGPTKSFNIDLDPRQLMSYHVSVPQVVTALSNANANAGAYFVDIGVQSYNVRGIGLFKTLADMQNVVVAEKNGTPVYIKQLGRVRVGREVPLGRVGRDNSEDITEGIVLMRVGGQTLPTVRGVEKMADKLNKLILPRGMRIVPYYDRTDLTNVTTHTVLHVLFSGMVLVALVLVAFLGDFKAALIVAITIPLSLCFAFIIMVARGDSANLISMGAIDFGIIVDATVIMVENIHRHLTQPGQGLTNMRLIASEASREVVSPIFFATAALFVSYLPLFTMQGMEGKIFGPMAITYGLALLGSLILAYTFAPVSASVLLKQKAHRETLLVRWVRGPYTRVLRAAVSNPWAVTVITFSVLAGTCLVIPLLGGEFMPKLEEGNMWVRATMPMSISFAEATKVANRDRAIFDSYPEVTTCISQLGRPDDGSDSAGLFNCEFYVNLKPRNEWPDGETKEELTERIDARLKRETPSVVYNFSQNIEDNVEEALSGVKGMNSCKVFSVRGDEQDLERLESFANQIEGIMKGVRGVTDLGVFHEVGQPDMLIKTDREAAARYNLQVGDVNAIVGAIGGTVATNVLDRERTFPVIVRMLAPFRKTIDAIKRIPLMTPDGAAIPLGAVVNLETKVGAGFIYREDYARYIPVKFSVRGRDLKSAIDEADRKIRAQVKFPPGYFMLWSGEIEQLDAAMERLKFIVPITLILILFLLYKTFNNMLEGLLIAFTVPLASIGGVWALYLRHMPFSVSAGVGFISLLGVCHLEGVLLVSRIKYFLLQGLDLYDAVVEGAKQRMRPVMMVAAAGAIGLMPAALATGIGSETQRPLATVVVVGILTSGMVNLLVHPPMFYLLHIFQHGRGPGPVVVGPSSTAAGPTAGGSNTPTAGGN